MTALSTAPGGERLRPRRPQAVEALLHLTCVMFAIEAEVLSQHRPAIGQA
ncbi:hypothetical protein VLK31_02775 [Variovorax sp. H27-G14]